MISLRTPNPNLWAPKQQISFVTLRSEKPYLEIVSCSQGCLEMKVLAQGPAQSRCSVVVMMVVIRTQDGCKKSQTGPCLCTPCLGLPWGAGPGWWKAALTKPPHPAPPSTTPAKPGHMEMPQQWGRLDPPTRPAQVRLEVGWGAVSQRPSEGG